MNTSFSKRLINSTHQASTFRCVEPSFRQNVGPSSRKWIARCSTLLIWLFIGNGGGGRNPKNSWWGCAARFAKSWPYFTPKKMSFSHRFSDLGYLPFAWEMRKFWMVNQTAAVIPFEEPQKTWAVIWRDAIFALFLVCLADLDTHCKESFSHHVRFYSFLFFCTRFPPALFV